MFKKNKYDILNPKICWEEEKEYRIQVMQEIPYISRATRVPITSNIDFFIGNDCQRHKTEKYSPLHKIKNIIFGPKITEEEMDSILNKLIETTHNYEFILKNIKRSHLSQ